LNQGVNIRKIQEKIIFSKSSDNVLYFSIRVSFLYNSVPLISHEKWSQPRMMVFLCEAK